MTNLTYQESLSTGKFSLHCLDSKAFRAEGSAVNIAKSTWAKVEIATHKITRVKVEVVSQNDSWVEAEIKYTWVKSDQIVKSYLC